MWYGKNLRKKLLRVILEMKELNFIVGIFGIDKIIDIKKRGEL